MLIAHFGVALAINLNGCHKIRIKYSIGLQCLLFKYFNNFPW